MRYTEFDKTLHEILEGKTKPPNLKKEEWSPDIQRRMAHASKIHKPYHIIDEDGRRIYHPVLFCEGGGMGGSFKGSGIILTHDSIFSFWMCEHDWNDSGSNHIRGYHRSVCRKCGFDATIDSGD